MKSLHHTTSTAGGLVSPKVSARVDQQKYPTWLRQCLNMIPYKTGALTRLPGTHKMGQAKYANTAGNNYAIREIPFIFSTTTQFMLEFGDHYIRFYSNGQQVNISSAPTWQPATYYFPGTFVTDPFDGFIYYTVTGEITPGAPHSTPSVWTRQTILELFTPYGANAGPTGSIFDTDIFGVVPCQINDVVYLCHTSFPPYKLTRITDTNWTIQPVFFFTPALLDQNASDTILTPGALTGTMVITASAPAWVTANFYSIGNTVEVAGVIYECLVTHQSSTFATDLANEFWKVSIVFFPLHNNSYWELAMLRESSYLEVAGTASGGIANQTSSSIQCIGAYQVNTYGVWSNDVSIERSLDNGKTWGSILKITSRSDNNNSIPGTAETLGLYRIVVSNSATLVNAGATNPRIVFEVIDALLRGLVKITEYLTPYTVICNVVTQIYNSTQPAPLWVSGTSYYSGYSRVTYAGIQYRCIATVINSTTQPPSDPSHWSVSSIPISGTPYWSEGAWSDYRGYPRAIATFQQRVYYASSGFQPQRVWGTKTNDIENLDRSDPTLADGGLAFDLNASSKGPIVWLTSQSDLFAGLIGAEWVINAGSSVGGSGIGGAITPTAINAVEQGTFGSTGRVQPIIVGNAVFFAQRQSDALRQMLFSVYTAKYMSQDMTTLADYLFSSGIVQIAYQSRWHHQGIIWVVTKQGTLCGLTYDLDQEVFGWCERKTGYQQKDANGNAIPDDNGFESVSVLYGNGTSDDEVWVVANRLIGGVKTRFVERIDPNNWEETFTTSPKPPSPKLADAYYVDCGITVVNPGSLVIGGLSHLEGRYVIGLADGSAFGPLLVTGGLITLPPSIPTTVGKVCVGLPMVYAGQPMQIDSDPRAGNTQGLIKQISDIYVRVWNSMGGEISNGSTTYPLWISGQAYAVATNVISPLTQTAFQCVAATSGIFDPSTDPAWVAVDTPVFRQPVLLPYTNEQNNPFALPSLITTPTELRIEPHPNATPSSDPVFIVQGADALPLTILSLSLKYDLTGVP